MQWVRWLAPVTSPSWPHSYGASLFSGENHHYQLPSLGAGSAGGGMAGVEGERRSLQRSWLNCRWDSPLFIFPVEHHVVSTQSLPPGMINERTKSKEEIKPSDPIRTASHL